MSSANLMRSKLDARYRGVRRAMTALCEPLERDDYVVQPMDDVSPPKWHLAHTTWFFETFLLTPYLRNYKPVHPLYGYLFNSYYEAVGERQPRPQRGLLSRPTTDQVFDYRHRVDEKMLELLDEVGDEQVQEVESRVILGLHHEQQHQELLLMDIKNIFFSNPMLPVYQKLQGRRESPATDLEWVEHDGGLHWFGYEGEGFCFDNETPQHQVFLNPFKLANRCVTNGEYLEFMEAGGYEKPEYWLSDGWATVQREAWSSPLYWKKIDGRWHEFTLSGLGPLHPDAPVVHVSHFEADAFARWRNKRLPSEFEWEILARRQRLEGNFLESKTYHPRAAAGADELLQMYGDVWEITRSPYVGFPGYRAPAGALGEYNAKFMSGEIVMRGGSCVTPGSHIRPTYRNFYYPYQRWNFQGFRLAQDARSTR